MTHDSQHEHDENQDQSRNSRRRRRRRPRIGPVRRFPSKHHFAGYTGTAPLDRLSVGVEDNESRLSRLVG